MKRFITVCAVLLAMSTALFSPARAAEESPVCYPTAIIVSEDGTELRKIYDLSPEADPAGIPRSDFEQGGFHYTFTDILRQELPEYEERVHTETVSFDSPKKDMESVLALLPQEREAVTEDGFLGTLSLKLDSVRVEVSGYGSTTKELSATRTYPNLDGQDTACIPKSIEDNGKTLTLQSIDWQISNAANVDGYAVGERYTAVAVYAGTATSSYVKGYTVTAEYTGTVSRASETIPAVTGTPSATSPSSRAFPLCRQSRNPPRRPRPRKNLPKNGPCGKAKRICRPAKRSLRRCPSPGRSC